MSDGVAFSMFGNPRGKGRPRTRVVKSKTRGAFAHVYTDEKTREYESSIKEIAVAAMDGHPPLTGPLSVSIRLRLPIPASATKKQRARLLAGDEALIGRVDVDNGAKAILDPCNRVCFADDNQIVRLFVTKIAAERPGVDVKITPLAPQGEW